ncbi:putative F-box protein At4g38870 [Sesamum indicum]|uniref:F-box protein At4g38870 n=1 Tax=Sesamum indicum TaxID=4182 RepID=A0A6I9UA23_SESIN|nr:putative F-box protein At4g38870 [Sesamum indicum]
MNTQDKDLKAVEHIRAHQMVEMKGIGYLPRDMIIEILSRLPAKVLCKCRCVSKSWHDLLTRDVEFMTRHVQWSKQKPLLLVRRYISDGIGELNKSKITIELTSIDMQGDVTDKFRKVIDGPVHTFVSCGPLSILCCMYSLYVCNPSIHQVVRVPYHANSRLYNIGFGYLPVSNEYKIVHMFYHSFIGNGKMGCEIFSFKTGEGVTSGSWRGIGDCPFSAWTDEYPVSVNGTIYWALSSGWKDKSILSLDLEKEEFSCISYPIHESKKYNFLEYIGLMSTLCVVGFSAEASTMDIWMLKEKKNKTWAMEYSINLFPLCPKFLVPSDDHSEEILVHMEQRDLICYSLKSQTSRRIGYYRAMKTYNKPCLYYGSLIPMHSSSF